MKQDQAQGCGDDGKLNWRLPKCVGREKQQLPLGSPPEPAEKFP